MQDFFRSYDCKLLTSIEDFIGKRSSNLKFKCKCGNVEDNVCFQWYKRSTYKACKKCLLDKTPRRTAEFNQMAEFFLKYECKLLTKKADYINNKTKNLTYQCKCGNVVKNESYLLYSLSVYKCCDDCRDKLINRRYRPFEDVVKLFADNGVQLLTKEEEYTGANCTRLDYKCKCGNVEKNVTYHSFELSKHKACKKCVTKKTKEMFLKKYGCENPMQNVDVLTKSIHQQYKSKDFTFPSGRLVKVQGYEDLALKILLEDHDEADLLIDRTAMPMFDYFHENRVKKYLPDIYVKSENKIIEVKSDRTFNFQRVQNILKALAVRNAGYDFEFWIFNKCRKDDVPNYKYPKTILKLTKV